MGKIQRRRAFNEAEQIASSLVTSEKKRIKLQQEWITPQNLIDIYGGSSIEQSALSYINETTRIGIAYAEALADPANLSAHGRKVLGETKNETYALKARLRLATNKYDLRLLNKENAEKIQRMHMQQRLKVDELIETVGMPGMSLPTSSPYNYYLNILAAPDQTAGRSSSSFVGLN